MKMLPKSRAIPYFFLGVLAAFSFITMRSMLFPDTPKVACLNSADVAKECMNAFRLCSDTTLSRLTRDSTQTELTSLMRKLIEKLDTSADVYGKQGIDRKSLVGNHMLNADANLMSHFKRIVTPEQKEALFVALQKLNQVSSEHDFTWMLYSGTLLGSFRHHDMVPWDDDFDILMNHAQRHDVIKSLSSLTPDFHLFEAGARLKFWSANGTIHASDYAWKWPYLDISFYRQNDTHIWDASMEHDYGDRSFVYGKNIVFPLHMRPMGQHLFPAPRDSWKHLQLTYNVGALAVCKTPHYSHKHESLVVGGVHYILCEELKRRYPFVHRSVGKVGEVGVLETLMLNGKEVHHMVVNEPPYAITDPYSLRLVTP